MFRASRSVLGKVLVCAQAGAKGVSPSTLSAVTAAAQLGEVTALVAGKEAAEAVAKVTGVSKVLYSDGAEVQHDLGENFASMASNVAKSGSFTHVLAPSSAFGKSVAPRVGVLLDSQPLSDVSDIFSEDTFGRATYAGNAVTKVKVNSPFKVLTVRGASFEKAGLEGSAALETTESSESGHTTWVSDEVSQSDKPDLQSAERVVSGGKGLKDPSNWHLVEAVADKLGAAVGATRAVVDAGWVPSDLQVGQTGKIVAPTLYVAAGISGAIQHVTGMKDSKTIVSINTDPEAPMMALADYGLEADALKALPELAEKL